MMMTSDDPNSSPSTVSRLNHAIGPVAAGMIIDAVDIVTLGPVGLILGPPCRCGSRLLAWTQYETQPAAKRSLWIGSSDLLHTPVYGDPAAGNARGGTSSVCRRRNEKCNESESRWRNLITANARISTTFSGGSIHSPN